MATANPLKFIFVVTTPMTLALFVGVDLVTFAASLFHVPETKLISDVYRVRVLLLNDKLNVALRLFPNSGTRRRSMGARRSL